MTSAADVELHLKARGITPLLTDDGQVYLRPDPRPGYVVTDDHVRLVREHKDELIALLRYRQRLDVAGDAAVDESPRALEPREKAIIARLLRTEYQSDDEAIRDTLAWCEELPPHREWLLAKAAEGER